MTEQMNPLPDDSLSPNNGSPTPEPTSNEVDASFIQSFEEFLVEQKKLATLYAAYSGTDRYVDDLKTAFADFEIAETFNVGQLIQWKPFLKNKTYPDYGKPAVVVQIWDVPRTEDAEGKKLLIPRDLLVGYLDGEQDFVLFSTSSNRFIPWDDSSAQAQN